MEAVGLLASLGVYLTFDELVRDAQEERGSGEPFLYGLHRVENIYVQLLVSDRWQIRNRGAVRFKAFPDVSYLQSLADRVTKRALRMFFADPAKPNRIIFERFPRQDDALPRFLEIDQLLRSASCVGDLEHAQGTDIWPVIESAIGLRRYRT